MRVLLCEASLRVSFFVHVNMSDSEEMWEENSIDSGGFSQISLPELSSDDYSDHVEVAEEDVNVIRGAELYRFEPLARPCRVVEQDARDDDQPVQPPAGNNDRLTQRSYAILMSLMNPYSNVFCTYLHCI